MKVIANPDKFQTLSLAWHRGRKAVGFVPTMGALHEGHLELVRRARKENDVTVVSIYVNPLQFGPQEDFSKYPRTLAADLRLLKKEGVDAVFTPSDRVFYPEGYATHLQVKGPLVKGLCAPYRPGHFDGVATVVTKLLGVVMPGRLYLGQKDFQQVAVLRQVVKDLHLPVRIVTCPTVREADGLARSSRNLRLSTEGRRSALALSRALFTGRDLYRSGKKDAKGLLQAMRSVLQAQKGVRVQYLEAVEPDKLTPVKKAAKGTVFLVAAYVEGVRLIDNIQL